MSEISLEGKGLSALPMDIVNAHKDTATKLNFRGNKLTDASYMDTFTSLETLVLDRNGLSNVNILPKLPSLRTLWLNNNHINDLTGAITQLKQKFPELTYLSMMMNPACPNVYLSEDNVVAYQRYRDYIITQMPQLVFLDATPITPAERKQASTRTHVHTIARPASTSTSDTKTVDPRVYQPKNSPARSAKPPKVGSFLATSKPRYDGTNSEGNRFITNDEL